MKIKHKIIGISKTYKDFAKEKGLFIELPKDKAVLNGFRLKDYDKDIMKELSLIDELYSYNPNEIMESDIMDLTEPDMLKQTISFI